VGAGRGGGSWSWREAGGPIEERSGEMDRDWGKQEDVDGEFAFGTAGLVTCSVGPYTY